MPKFRTERIHCGRCRMSFRVELPRYGTTRGRSSASWTRCSEPGCGRRFWHGQSDSSKHIICGVDPNDTEQRHPGVERATSHSGGAPAVVLAVTEGCLDLPKLSPARGSAETATHEPAAFSEGWGG